LNKLKESKSYDEEVFQINEWLILFSGKVSADSMWNLDPLSTYVVYSIFSVKVVRITRGEPSQAGWGFTDFKPINPPREVILIFYTSSSVNIFKMYMVSYGLMSSDPGQNLNLSNISKLSNMYGIV
jgi:hypothetical protein